MARTLIQRGSEIEVDRGSLNINEVQEYLLQKIDQITRKIVLDFFTIVVEWTPVDTGRARAGWNMSKGRPSTRVPEEDEEHYEDPSPNRLIYQASNLAIWFIVNNVEYIEVLDDGRGYRDGQVRGSEQAPNGMVSIAFEELERSLT